MFINGIHAIDFFIYFLYFDNIGTSLESHARFILNYFRLLLKNLLFFERFTGFFKFLNKEVTVLQIAEIICSFQLGKSIKVIKKREVQKVCKKCQASLISIARHLSCDNLRDIEFV